MARFHFLRKDGAPISASTKAFGVSVGVHATIAVVLVVGIAGNSIATSRASRPEPGIVGESRNGTQGTGSVAAPTVGPSLTPELGAKYVGRYEWASVNGSARFVEVHLINHGETVHWSLAVSEDRGSLRTLNAVAQDTFVFQLATQQRVIFRRHGDSVNALSIRRGNDSSWAMRVRAP